MVRGKVTRPGHAGKEGKLVVCWAEDERLTSVRDSLSPLCEKTLLWRLGS